MDAATIPIYKESVLIPSSICVKYHTDPNAERVQNEINKRLTCPFTFLFFPYCVFGINLNKMMAFKLFSFQFFNVNE